jgi:hypothetical protein
MGPLALLLLTAEHVEPQVMPSYKFSDDVTHLYRAEKTSWNTWPYIYSILGVVTGNWMVSDSNLLKAGITGFISI